MIKGIGPVYARKLMQAFGAAVFDAIEQAPERLQEVAGIGPKRALRIRTGWAEQKVIREIMLFLHSHGVGTSCAVRIFKTSGLGKATAASAAKGAGGASPPNRGDSYVLGSARFHTRYDIVSLPPDLIGFSVLRWSLSPSILTPRG